jgi:hypothetical protein
MLNTLTPIVAQSSDEASLTNSETVPVCGAAPMVEEPDPPPPLHAANVETSAQQMAAESAFVRM